MSEDMDDKTGSDKSGSVSSGQYSEGGFLEVVETDPKGKYVRYSEILVEGSGETVYKALLERHGIEVAWSKMEVPEEILQSEERLQKLHEQAKLLKSLKHENVLRCYKCWVDVENKTVNMIIQQYYTTVSLGEYSRTHSHRLGIRVIKKWARQILKGLDYLHSHYISHGNLQLDNIRINRCTGRVKIGDVGLFTLLEHATTSRSITSSVECVASENSGEDYDLLRFDIYSFGMCMLQIITHEQPDSEYENSAQLYMMIQSGVKPALLEKVNDPELRIFIDKCFAPAYMELDAIDLLEDPFLASDSSHNLSLSGSLESVTSSSKDSVSSAKVLEIHTEKVNSSFTQHQTASSSVDPPLEIVKSIITEEQIITLRGMMKDRGSISMTLWFVAGRKTHAADFVYSPQHDTVQSVTNEMVEMLELPADDAPFVAKMMEKMVTELVSDSDHTTPADKEESQTTEPAFGEDKVVKQLEPAHQLEQGSVSSCQSSACEQTTDGFNQEQKKAAKKYPKKVTPKAISNSFRKLVLSENKL